MKIDLSKIVSKKQTIAVAVSGGSDSMALLHFMSANAKKYGIKVIGLNVEHGIRGEASKSDTEFVKSYCRSRGIELLTYSFDALKKAKTDKMSVEQAARILRYECFFKAIDEGKCDKVATAHHRRDNVESVLLNLFRGTGLKGVAGINANYEDKIIRPFLTVTKEEIIEYMTENSVPYITDETNFSDDYTRNYIRLNVLPKIRDAFPEAEKCIARFAEIAKSEDDFMDGVAKSALKFEGDKAEITLPLHPAVLSRAVIIALKKLGIEKDWEKTHVDSVIALTEKQNGAKINLPKNVCAIKEYDKVVLFLQKKK
ncbi:MAG: tRNA lysidine(34) synthetase TilS [Clostridia bacterium]|nr:tRNA lysidine(34) synthetase TilS [Clostridia bacterium]